MLKLYQKIFKKSFNILIIFIIPAFLGESPHKGTFLIDNDYIYPGL